MTCAIILFSIWTAIVLGIGCLINYVAGCTGLAILISGTNIVVLILEVLAILIGLGFVLLYAWSCKVSAKIERKIDNKRRKIKQDSERAKKEINRTVKESKEEFKNSMEENKEKMKEWYNKQWFAIEDDDNPEVMDVLYSDTVSDESDS